ncbi:MAG: ABC transporter permease [Gulosibacter sp.]|uniref:ABC transporter permease n=1 Tax=Gulosibacter sp. TaxID=2817531 RepID=UPI003F8DC651
MDQTLDPTRIVIMCLCMALLAAGILWRAKVPLGWEPVVAIVRAGLQLAVLALILSFIMTNVGWVFAWLGVMLIIAVFTAANRIGMSARVLLAVALSIASGVTAAIGIAFGTGTIELGAQYLLAVGGIVIGNAMTVTTLSARHLREQLADHRGEIEGWLSLGATNRQATARFRAAAAKLSLIPSIDQTKTTGLVTLPGAFTGAVFAGASPIDAGLFQLVVLAGLLLSGAIASIIIGEVLGSPAQVPVSSTPR